MLYHPMREKKEQNNTSKGMLFVREIVCDSFDIQKSIKTNDRLQRRISKFAGGAKGLEAKVTRGTQRAIFQRD